MANLKSEVGVVRKVIAYELLSLDGVADRPDEFFFDFDDVMSDNLKRVIDHQDAVLLGRRTYDEWAAFWPPSDIEPFATFINHVAKYVVSSTAMSADWANSSLLAGDPYTAVQELRERAGGDIGVHGSVSLTQSLLARGLVDELRLVVAPVLQGRGRKLFASDAASRLSLTRSDVSPSGYLLLDYRFLR